MPVTPEMIDEAVSRYEREYDRYLKLADLVAQKCRALVREKLVQATVQWRAKDPKSFRNKILKINRTPARAGHFNSVEDIFAKISDFSGVRITTYVEKDRLEVVEKVKEVFTGSAEGEAVEALNKDKKITESFYRAIHCQVLLKNDVLSLEQYSNLKGLSCEIQICSLLGHVWNEIEHDFQYKPLTGTLSKTEIDLLMSLGHLTVAGDTIINQLIEANSTRRKNLTTPFEDALDFTIRMRSRFTAATEFRMNAEQLFEELLALGFDTPKKIEDHYFEKNHLEAAYQSLAKLVEHASTDLELNKKSSDILLMLVLNKSAGKILERHPMGRGHGRPLRIARIAKLFSDHSKEIKAAS